MFSQVLLGEARGKLVQGDCLKIMPHIPDKSIDMILCDLPYGTTACKWDVVIPFGSLWEQYKRIIKDCGAIVLMASQPFTSALIMSNVKWFKYCWYWKKEKGTGFATSGKRPLMIVEDVCVFYKKQPLYNPERELLEKPYRHTLPISKSKSGGKDNLKNLSNDGERIYKQYTHKTPHQLLNFSRDNSNKGMHPTQKPVALFEYLIKTYTNEDDIVLDNCIGSGTTAAAAENLDRRWIGIELDPEYARLASERMLRNRAERASRLF